MADKFISVWFMASLDTYEHKKLFGTETRYSQRSVNFDSFSTQLKTYYEELDAQGYDVVNVIPISMGHSEQCMTSGGNYVGDVGFSITRGAVLVGKLRE